MSRAPLKFHCQDQPWSVVFRIIFLVLLCAIACSHPPTIWVHELPSKEKTVRKLRVADTLQVQLLGASGFSEKRRIHIDGSVNLPLIGAQQAQGRTVSELTQHLKKELARIIKAPQINVSLVTAAPLRISVIGEVQEPGYFQVDESQGVLQVLSQAGGFTEFAKKDEIYLIRSHHRLPRIRFSMKTLQLPDSAAARFRLLDGDVVFVE
ncbi:MAG: polysaccharide export protein [Polyangiaceae bacterium]|nr:polysaccharide export protein [Polyangiaceae bacterium]